LVVVCAGKEIFAGLPAGLATVCRYTVFQALVSHTSTLMSAGAADTTSVRG
jgi:hypothetical protein